MKKTLLLVVLVAIIAAFTQNQTNVKGRVTDELGNGLKNVKVSIKGQHTYNLSDNVGDFSILAKPEDTLVFTHTAYHKKEIAVKGRIKINVVLKAKEEKKDLVQALEDEISYSKALRSKVSGVRTGSVANIKKGHGISYDPIYHNTEDFASIHEHIFHDPKLQPLSTFSIDVDAASYSNVRRFINNGNKPPIDAVRIEEMINYFNYTYEEPATNEPFSRNVEIAECPWQKEHLLMHVGIKGKSIAKDKIPPSNIVFLIDVSGSMNAPNKLPLLKTSYRMLVDEMRPQDRIAIAVYAGAAGMVLQSTPGSDKKTIMNAIENLSAGGSTAGGAGIKLAYQIAEENFIEGGNNRIILATDGDFNIGISSNGELERMIEQKRDKGVFLTVLGFGMGNYKDDKLEILADKGNGNYAYIDNISEAKKVLVNEFGATLFTIAKDVKIQVEFNPSIVAAYRLIGYENRKLNAEDFNNDKKDAGEIGAGHTVTALYQIIPVGVSTNGFLNDVDPLKYQQLGKAENTFAKELGTLKIRYKNPDANKSQLLSLNIPNTAQEFSESSVNYRFSASVASFGLWLRNSEFMGSSNLKSIKDMAHNAMGEDQFGYRAEFIRLVEQSKYLADRSY